MMNHSRKQSRLLLIHACCSTSNSEDPITIQVDASSIGVGAALMQQGRVVSYHSRALTPTQQRYSNIERVLWTCKLDRTFSSLHIRS